MVDRLGHDRFYIQGGDWGSMITTSMAIFFPEHIIGFHTNMANSMSMGFSLKRQLAKYFPKLYVEENEMWMLKRMENETTNLLVETGYLHIQATKPDSMVGLTTSPAALAAWILEKFSTGTNIKYRNLADGGLHRRFTNEDLLGNLMIYWVSQAGVTSARIYYENFGRADTKIIALNSLPVDVPTGIAIYPNEIATIPKSILSNRYRNIVHFEIMERGGHFAAFEESMMFSRDIIKFVQTVESLNNEKK